jgi:hypothetical protein
VIRRVRALAKRTSIEKAWRDVNDVVREAIALVQPVRPQVQLTGWFGAPHAAARRKPFLSDPLDPFLASVTPHDRSHY